MSKRKRKKALEFVCYNVDLKGQSENVRTTTTVTHLVMSGLTAHVCVCELYIDLHQWQVDCIYGLLLYNYTLYFICSEEHSLHSFVSCF